MPHLRLAAAALNTTPLDWAGNARLIRAAFAAARQTDASLVCLPELCLTGYGCEDMFFSAGVLRTALEELPELVGETAGLITCFGLPISFESATYNCVAVACDGALLGIVAKQFLAGDGIHYEPRWFRPWPAGRVEAVRVGDVEVPLGDLLFDCGGVKIGFEICRDAWVTNRTGCQLAARGANVLLNPSASHFAFAKQTIRDKFVLDGSRDFDVAYAYANLLGNEAGRAIFDGGTLIAAGGKMLLRGPRFSYADWVLSSAVVETKKGSELFSDRQELAAGLISAAFDWPAVPISDQAASVSTGIVLPDDQSAVVADVASIIPGHPAWETGGHWKAEEFARAVPLALFDYLRKSRANGFVVSLSGGADSAAVALMVHLMVQLAGREVGLGNVRAKLNHSVVGDAANSAGASEVESFDDEAAADLVRRLLTCVYQSTRNSGDVTRLAARQMALATGSKFFEWNIDALVEGFVETVANAVDRPISWDTDDVALQNIQARTRGPGAWLLANLCGALLLTTSNRSEAAVGYATMDGDTCGGLAPIAGIDKAFLLEWLDWMETTGPAGIGPFPALAVINQQAPTAELRPPSHCQTDEGDLMPYRILDAIERSAIRDKLLPVEVLEAIRPRFPEQDPRQLARWVERFFVLWCRNQWKRERYAPSFHLDDENLDPKTWCRFPILNSGFEKELAELRARFTSN